ncbi:aspartate aminotransferase family protein [Brevibacillus sp. B_LB10_24]|uniref:aspartate aminotransferase family protein n=1 Tax=Brevibacillus sp. B_LB10_24 TaxID=3380645 RepID=UPI0038B8A14F
MANGILPGDKARAVLEKESKYLCAAAAATTPIVWKEALGATVVDVDDNRYIDFTSGILVANVGHSHPKVVKAIQEQAGKFLNAYNSAHQLRADLCERLTALFPSKLNRALLLTTGAEAIESAVKIAKAYTGKNEIISFNGSFHGKTHLTMSIGGIRQTKEGFGPQASNVVHAPFPYVYHSYYRDEAACVDSCLQQLRETMATSSTGSIAAVVMESYLGSGGCVVPPARFVQGVRQLCDQHNIVFIVDEVQAGFGRTGKMFGFEHYGVVPDIVCLAKGLSAGVPTSAVVAGEGLMKALPPGSASSTYGGNPLSCAAALAVLDVIESEGLVQRAEALGQVLAKRLKELEQKYPFLGEGRSIGLVTGLEIVEDPATRVPSPALANAIVNEAIGRGLALISPTGLYGNVIRMMPPLVISEELMNQGLDILDEAMAKVSDDVSKTQAGE